MPIELFILIVLLVQAPIISPKTRGNQGGLNYLGCLTLLEIIITIILYAKGWFIIRQSFAQIVRLLGSILIGLGITGLISLARKEPIGELTLKQTKNAGFLIVVLGIALLIIGSI